MITDLEFRLLNDFQRDFPLVARPYAMIARQLGVHETDVLEILSQLRACGMISRVGPVFRPNSIGASTLAAMAVPPERLDEVAQLVNTYSEVNHNYEREHHYNLWFVVTAPDEARIQAILSEIGCHTDCQVLNLPLLEDFHIDLGFDLTDSKTKRKYKTSQARISDSRKPSLSHPLSQKSETLLISEIQQGLPLLVRPFAEIGRKIDLPEEDILSALQHLIEQGVIKRMGVIVRHLELGYRANAMVVWDVADERVEEIGRRLGSIDCVTLCYRRPRQLPSWRYNLFTMIHGQHRNQVLHHLKQLQIRCDLEKIAHEVLFSCRRFKQRGALYVTDSAPKWSPSSELAG